MIALQLLIMQLMENCDNNYSSGGNMYVIVEELNKLPDDYALSFNVQLSLIYTASKAFSGP